jgi:hypothetical protein
MQQSTVQDHRKEDFNLKLYCAWCSHMNCWMLTWIHTIKHVVHCWTLLLNTTSCLEVFFTDECPWRKCCVLGYRESLHFTFGFLAAPIEMLQAGSGPMNGFSDPVLASWSIDAVSYAGMLEAWLIPQCRDRGLIQDVWLQHDGEPAHFGVAVCIVLSEHYLGCWIGHGSPTSPTPLSCPLLTHDLTTLASSLWRIIMGQVAAHRCHNNDELHRAVEQVFTSVTPQMLRCMSHRTQQCIRLCSRHDGAHAYLHGTLWLSPRFMLSRGTVTFWPPCAMFLQEFRKWML